MYREKFYTKPSTLFGDLYPGAKLFLLVCYTIGTLLLNKVTVTKYNLPLFLIPSTLLVVLLFYYTKCFKSFVTLIKTITVFLLLLLILQVFFMKGDDGTIIWQLGFVKVYAYGLGQAICYVCNITSLAGIFTWMFSSTSYRDMCLAFQKMGLTFKAAYVFLSTFGMIDALSRSLKIIMNSQRARGVETEGNLKTRLGAFLPSLVPLVVSSFISIEERALTLEAKGFNYDGPKSNLIEIFPSGKEWVGYLTGAVYLLITAGGFVACNLL